MAIFVFVKITHHSKNTFIQIIHFSLAVDLSG